MRLSDVAAIACGTLYGDCEFDTFEIDSRKVKKGNIFICIKGERSDGHDYAVQAMKNGASGILAERITDAHIPTLVVPDTIRALQDFAAYYRRTLDVKVVAVTGSVGKTSTKECIASVLKTVFRTHKTFGNMNSETGLPRTLLDIKSDDEMAVTEMGMSGFGEISLLSCIAFPNIGVITNIGVSHIEKLGTRENILKAKLELLDGLDKNGLLVYNGDDKYLVSAKDKMKAFRTVTYGLQPECDVRAENITEDGSLRFTVVTPSGSTDVQMPCEGKHNVYNALASVCVGLEAGVPLEKIAEGLKEFSNVPMRQQKYEKDGFNIIEDCYNAGPESMTSALSILRRKSGRRIAVLGDMLELGAISDGMHRRIGAETCGIDVIIFFGDHNACFTEGALGVGVDKERIHVCASSRDAGKLLKSIANRGDYILVKASRGMHGEYALKEFFGE